MNFFRLDNDPPEAAKLHVNHPCAVWVRSGLDNYMWGLGLAAALVDEFRFRFDRRHAAADVVAWLSRNVPTRLLPGATPPPQAMPEELRGDDAVAAYRRYYAAEKQGYWVGERWVASKWTRRDVPSFMVD